MSNRRCISPALVILGLTLIYFVAFPEDLAVLTYPVEKVLGISQAVSPWLYLLIGFIVLAWVVVRIWGSKPRPAEVQESRPLG